MGPAVYQITYLVTLQDRRQMAEHTMAFQFEKPDGFTLTAGQSLDLTLMSPSQTDREGNGHMFSIASAPDEGLLLVATQMRDTAFKQVLGTLPIGSHVTIEGPFGNLVLHHDQALREQVAHPTHRILADANFDTRSYFVSAGPMSQSKALRGRG